jgi:N-acetylglucosamine kinase-like BadF-type ATPase
VIESAAYFGVDGGGSHTRARLSVAGRETETIGPPLNPASVGRRASVRAWNQVLSWLVGQAAGAPLCGWFGVAEFSSATRNARARVVEDVARTVGLRGTFWLTNDLVPIVLGPPLWGDGIVVAVGTGSGVVARSAASGLVARAGGYEYILSDEGSGFDIGLRGLRAAARVHQGRGPQTTLLDHAVSLFGLPIPDLGRHLAEMPLPKETVARFAERVCQAWVAGDSVAGEIVRGAVAEMAGAVEHCAAAVRARHPLPCVVVGSIPAGCPSFFALLEQEIGRRSGSSACLADAPARIALELARSGREPPADESGVLAIAAIAVGDGR